MSILPADRIQPGAKTPPAHPKIQGKGLIQGRAVTTPTYTVPIRSKIAKLAGEELLSTYATDKIRGASALLALPLEAIYRTTQIIRVLTPQRVADALCKIAGYANEVGQRVITKQQYNEAMIRTSVTDATDFIPGGSQALTLVGGTVRAIEVGRQTEAKETIDSIGSYVEGAATSVIGESATEVAKDTVGVIGIAANESAIHQAGELQKRCSTAFWSVIRSIIGPTIQYLASFEQYALSLRNRNLSRLSDPEQIGNALIRYADKTASLAWKISHPYEKTRTNIPMCTDEEFNNFKSLAAEGKRVILKETLLNDKWPLSTREYQSFATTLERWITSDQSTTTLEAFTHTLEDVRAMKTLYSIFMYVSSFKKISDAEYQEFCSQPLETLDLVLSIVSSYLMDAKKRAQYKEAITRLKEKNTTEADKESLVEMMLDLKNIPEEHLETLVTASHFEELSNTLKFRLLKTISRQTANLSDDKCLGLASLTQKAWSKLDPQQKSSYGEIFLPYFNRLSRAQKNHLFDISKKEILSLSDSERVTFLAEVHAKCTATEDIADEFADKFPEAKFTKYAEERNSPEARKWIRKLVKFINTNLPAEDKKDLRASLEDPIALMEFDEKEIHQMIEKIEHDLQNAALPEETKNGLEEILATLQQALVSQKDEEEIETNIEELETKLHQISVAEQEIATKISSLDKNDTSVDALTADLERLSISRKATDLSLKTYLEAQSTREKEIRARGAKELAQAESLLPSKSAGTLHAPLAEIDERIGKGIATQGGLLTPFSVSGKALGLTLAALLYLPQKDLLWSGKVLQNKRAAMATGTLLRTLALGTRVAYMLGCGPVINAFALRFLSQLGPLGQMWIDHVEKRAANLPMVPVQAVVKSKQYAASAVDTAQRRLNNWATHLFSLQQESELLKKGSSEYWRKKLSDSPESKKKTLEELHATFSKELKTKKTKLEQLRSQEQVEKNQYATEKQKIESGSDMPEIKAKRIKELTNQHKINLQRITTEAEQIPKITEEIKGLQTLATMSSQDLETQIIQQGSDPFLGMAFMPDISAEKQPLTTMKENIRKTQAELTRVRNLQDQELTHYRQERKKILLNEKIEDSEQKRLLDALWTRHVTVMDQITKEEKWIPVLTKELDELAQLTTMSPEELQKTLDKSPYIGPVAQCKMYNDLFNQKIKATKKRLKELDAFKKEDDVYWTYVSEGKSLIAPSTIEKQVEEYYPKMANAKTEEERSKLLEERDQLLHPFASRKAERAKLYLDLEKLQKLTSMKPEELLRSLETGTDPDHLIAAVTNAAYPYKDRSYWEQYVRFDTEKAKGIVSPEVQKFSTAYKMLDRQEVAYAEASAKALAAEEALKKSSWFVKSLATTFKGGTLAGYYMNHIQPKLDSVQMGLSATETLSTGALGMLQDTRRFENELAFKALASLSKAGPYIADTAASASIGINKVLGQKTAEAMAQLQHEDIAEWERMRQSYAGIRQKYIFGPIATLASTAATVIGLGAPLTAFSLGTTIAPVVILPFLIERVFPDMLDKMAASVESRDAGTALVNASAQLQSARNWIQSVTSRGFTSLGKQLQSISNQTFSIVDPQRIQGFTSLSESEKKHVFELIEKSESIDKQALQELHAQSEKYFEHRDTMSPADEELFVKTLLLLYNNLQPQDFLHISPSFYDTLPSNIKNRVFHAVKHANKDVTITTTDQLIDLFNKLTKEEELESINRR